jgi:RHS repeat-associated protein
MPNRHFADADGYRYGFNGMEKDDEVKGSTGTVFSTTWRGYNSRLGRWWSVDPMTNVLPSESPYNFANNIPTVGADPAGDICPPCIAIALLAGALTYPTIAANPTGNPEQDAIAIANAQEIQAKWVVYTLFSAGVASGAITAEIFLEEVSTQYGTQVLFKSIESYDENGKINVANVLFDAAANIDVFDAAFGKFSGNKILDNVLTAAIDITPEEAQILGLNKDVKSASLDLVLNSIAGETKIVKGKYSSILDKAKSKAQEVAGDELKKAFQTNNNFIQNIETQKIGVPDKTDVSIIKPEYIKELDAKDEGK